MNLKEIAAISGKSGLYKIAAETRTGIIVHSLDEPGRKIPISSNHQVAILEDVSIYAEDTDEISLKKIILNIFKKDGKEISVTPKDSSAKLREFFAEVAPGYDEERVYTSDIKKVIKWYQALVSSDLVNEKAIKEFESEKEKAEKEPEDEKADKKVKTEKAKKAGKNTTAVKKPVSNKTQGQKTKNVKTKRKA
jgi:hypothetical protein